MTSNILCLCANYHVLFDAGAIVVIDDLTLSGATGSLRTIRMHKVDRAQLAYQREHAAKQGAKKVKRGFKKKVVASP